MANPELAIAKASFSAILFRKEPVSLTRSDIDTFHTLLHDAIHQCSPANVQKCKRWILKNLVPSPPRVAALGKYLSALSNSLPDEAKTKPSTRRRRLHILYILNDVLYHAVVRDQVARIATDLEASLTTLLHGAAKFRNCPKQTRKVEDLLALWEKHNYFSAATIDGLRKAVKEAPNGEKVSKATTQDQTGSNLGSKLPKDAPYMIPSIHGDPNTPWFDLPAANWLPHLTPNSTKPMNPDMIKPLQLAPGPADKVLANAVKNLLVDVERLYSKHVPPQAADSQQHMDVSEMGERIVLDEITGEIVDGETYYGWSRRFCEKMKQRRKKATKGDDGRGRGRSHSRSRSNSYSPGRSSGSDSMPAFKRRRLSPDSRSPSRSRSRRRSLQRDRYDSRYSPSRSRSRSSSRRRYKSRSRSRDRRPRRDESRTSKSPPPNHNRHNPEFGPGYYGRGSSHNQQPPPPSYHNSPAFPPYPPPLPLASGFSHFPPPPPQGYQGQWPPPPPPPPHMGTSLPPHSWSPPPGSGVPPPHTSGWAPPPPPQQQQQHQYQQFGRGNGGYRGRGERGGYDRGRGGW
ncbi:uncharacterized protein LY79DRAFT_622128 [Colletotrichum navitas]|uniref:CID domain-containing protein n=1 Tax=Colletotrichum navitas TaxID=681940 RepID=A0AAD8QBD8_9PEZI|nr:uncharacterized protein LY79DRAFT_622128 [Colletotrichum navitas]KAK1599461.1 hypothetical protein LY79DRAFT_622128 [Colletotrichum navitas]